MDETAKAQVQQMINDAIAKAADFSTRKRGDTPTDDTQLTPRGYVTSVLGDYIPLGIGVQKGDIIDFTGSSVASRLAVGSDGTVLTANSAATGGISWSSISSSFNVFGDGSDGAAVVDGSSSINGATHSGSVYTLTRDVYYTDTTISSSVSINTGGYRIYTQGTLTINAGGNINRNGRAASSTVGGASVASGSLPGGIAGANGGNGGAGGSGSGGPGSAGSSGSSATPTTRSIGSSSESTTNNSAAKGGTTPTYNQTIPGGNSILGAIATPTSQPPNTIQNALFAAEFLTNYNQYQSSASPGGGSGGGGGAAEFITNGGAGGAGGGSGGSAGIVGIYSNKIINNAMKGISADGGKGASGLDGINGQASSVNAASGGGGGGGGNGGSGGAIIVVYHSSVQNGTFTVTGGTGGAGGAPGLGNGVTGASDGTGGFNGNNGATGKIWLYQV